MKTKNRALKTCCVHMKTISNCLPIQSHNNFWNEAFLKWVQGLRFGGMDMCLFQECLDSNALPLHSPLARFSLFIYIPRGIMRKRRRDGTFWKPNACQSKWFAFGNASLFVRDRICLIMCSPNTLQKYVNALWIWS